MAYYTLTINRYFLQAEIHLMDIVIANSGGQPYEVYVDGRGTDSEQFKFLYRIGPANLPDGSICIQNIGIYHDPLMLRIITNRFIPGHCVVRLYLKNEQGLVIGVLSEFQLQKVAD
ncbi:hypothetical protein [Paenibacillus sp. J22TS3]|uniref:hypothetical protein n=1 Tax=Paenibacillus sp. J22TS3 TaxID=2807192 RepID=UPI001B238A0D|nr:hypothetical protein [Paenibacillus sp. J22TS3]GIP24125.1 hypothetical protein J22TS3_44000 [Paenibacillus sp. J22TS3]